MHTTLSDTYGIFALEIDGLYDGIGNVLDTYFLVFADYDRLISALSRNQRTYWIYLKELRARHHHTLVAAI